MNDAIKTTSVVMAQIQHNAIILLDMKGADYEDPKYYRKLQDEMTRLERVAKNKI